jgi:hypothetical protein
MKAIIACITLATLCGCGGTDISSWLGSWNAAVTEQETCPPAPVNTTSLTGTLAIVAGTASDSIITQPPNGCDLTWTVSGNDATLVANQTCSVPGSAGGTWNPTFTTGGLTLNGNQIAVGDSGTGVLENGVTVQCTFNQLGVFTRN